MCAPTPPYARAQNTVPNAKAGAVSNTGYKVACSAAGDGSGSFSVCDSSTCGNCEEPVPFGASQCLAVPPQFGSRSVQFACGRASGGGGGVSPVTAGGGRNGTAATPGGGESGAPPAVAAAALAAVGVAATGAAVLLL